MAEPIVACPACGVAVMPHTAQCPHCQHVIDADALSASAGQDTGSVDLSDGQEDPCGSCGEMVRRGMVRCWNCGSFMRDDIAQKYNHMQENPSPVIYSEVPDAEIQSHVEPASMKSTPPMDIPLAAGDDDFALSPNYEMQEGQDTGDTYRLTAESAPAPPQEPAESPQASADAPARQSDPPETADTQPSAGSSDTPSGDSAAPDDGSQAAGGEASSSAQPQKATGETESEEAHSVATGGDALLEVALQEEAESVKRRGRGGRKRRASVGMRGGLLVYCPHGHRVEVQDRHRGRTGRCPKCKQPFFVPMEDWSEEQPETASPAEAPAAATEAAGDTAVAPVAENVWVEGVRLHDLDPTKLKLKPGSLADDGETADVRLDGEGLLITVLSKQAGLFGLGGAKPEAVREEVRAHLGEGKPVDELPISRKLTIDAEGAGTLRVVQPAPYAHESMFAGVAVFGEGRIAVRLPQQGGDGKLQFLSMTLSQFRSLAGGLSEQLNLDGLVGESGVPLEQSFEKLECHYSEEPVLALENVEFYTVDPAFTLTTVGRRCQACGLVVSEDARKKERIGGANGKAIARAKCPKCQQKFGSITLYGLEKTPAAAQESAGSGAGETGTE